MGPTLKKPAISSGMNICLVSMPWSIFNRPSIQLGTLKAYLELHADWLKVETKHPYLEVAAFLGTKLYHWISRNTWVSESLYSAVLFPEQTESAHSLAMKYAGKAEAEIKKAFNPREIKVKLENRLEALLESCDWSQYQVVGFTVCFNQLFATLAAARSLKDKFPGIKIVMGGSSCASAAGTSLLKTFSFIDYIIQGEGEESLLALCRHISGKGKILPKGIITSRPGTRPPADPTDAAADLQLSSLDSLPPPNFDDYFAELQKLFAGQPFIPVLPVEFSRGCWWNRCAFCNLNLQWCGYRFKKGARMFDEISLLASRYGCLDFTFTDNMIPPRESLNFFSLVEKLPVDFTFFAEIRTLSQKKPMDEVFGLYRRGGLTTIQVGIESLSSSLLKKMNKGTNVIDNIATMRAAAEYSLALEGNLIIQFPGSTMTEVEETLENLAYVFPYSPLSAAAFFLGQDSPVFNEPRKYQIRAITNHANNVKLFPRKILNTLRPIVLDYRGDRQYQRKLWKPVALELEKWRLYHADRKTSGGHRCLLTYRNGNNFLIIRQELLNGKVLHHRLKDLSKRIYLFCTQIRRDRELFDEFSTLRPDKILAFLADLREKRLLFSEKDRHLALAVRNKN